MNMHIQLIKCWICKQMYANKKHIMHTIACSDGKSHKICYNCKAELATRA